MYNTLTWQQLLNAAAVADEAEDMVVGKAIEAEMETRPEYDVLIDWATAQARETE